VRSSLLKLAVVLPLKVVRSTTVLPEVISKPQPNQDQDTSLSALGLKTGRVLEGKQLVDVGAVVNQIIGDNYVTSSTTGFHSRSEGTLS
jgi:hypothetical protein